MSMINKPTVIRWHAHEGADAKPGDEQMIEGGRDGSRIVVLLTLLAASRFHAGAGRRRRIVYDPCDSVAC